MVTIRKLSVGRMSLRAVMRRRVSGKDKFVDEAEKVDVKGTIRGGIRCR